MNESQHNVGVVFDSSNTGKAREFLFHTGSYLSREIVTSKDLATLVLDTISDPRNVQEVLNYSWQRGEQSHSFTWNLPAWTAFGEGLGLGITMGGANIDAEIEVSVRRKGLEVLQVKVRGKIMDFYNWDYNQDPGEATVQAGYGTIGYYGHIFKIKVYLDGVVPKIRYSFQ